jgi:DNA-binding NarL/FixJ family response regulator
MITVVVVDDHPVVRAGLRSLLDAEADIGVLGEDGDGQSAVDLIVRLQPDVVLLDLTLPGLSGLEVLRQVGKGSPGTKVLIVSMHTGASYVTAALHAGAAGYAVKSLHAGEIVDAVREVAAGRRYLSPSIEVGAPVIDTSKGSEADRLETLTPRERQVMQHTAEGLTNRQVGERLGISPRTVESHREGVMKKLGIRTHTDLVLVALRHGLITQR